MNGKVGQDKLLSHPKIAMNGFGHLGPAGPKIDEIRDISISKVGLSLDDTPYDKGLYYNALEFRDELERQLQQLLN